MSKDHINVIDKEEIISLFQKEINDICSKLFSDFSTGIQQQVDSLINKIKNLENAFGILNAQIPNILKTNDFHQIQDQFDMINDLIECQFNQQDHIQNKVQKNSLQLCPDLFQTPWTPYFEFLIFKKNLE